MSFFLRSGSVVSSLYIVWSLAGNVWDWPLLHLVVFEVGLTRVDVDWRIDDPFVS